MTSCTILSSADELSQLIRNRSQPSAKLAAGAAFVPVARNRLPEPLSRHRPHKWLWEPITSASQFPTLHCFIEHCLVTKQNAAQSEQLKSSLESGSGSRFQDSGDLSSFWFASYRKKTLTRIC